MCVCRHHRIFENHHSISGEPLTKALSRDYFNSLRHFHSLSDFLFDRFRSLSSVNKLFVSGTRSVNDRTSS